MKSAILLGLCLFGLAAMGDLFDDDERQLTFTEGISYDFRVYTDSDKPFVGTFNISADNAKDVLKKGKISTILYLRMTGMSYKRDIHIFTNVTNSTGTYKAQSKVVGNEGITSIFNGGDLNTVILNFDEGTCDNGCSVQFSLVAECSYTCFRSIGVRGSAHLGCDQQPFRYHFSLPYVPLTLNEWSSEVKLTRDSVTNPACFSINIETDGEDTIEHLVATERSNDGSPILVLAGSGNIKRPTQGSPSDWIMVNAQNYRYFKKGTNYLCISVTDSVSSEETVARIRVGAASTLSVSLFLLFAIATLLF